MKALLAAWRRLRTELAANNRLRLGAWSIAFILLVFLALLQRDRMAVAYEGYAAAADRMARAQRILGGHDWSAAFAAERQRNERLTALFWRADTQGLAQASLQAALTEMLGRLEFRNPRIRSGVSEPVPEAPGLWRIQAQVNASYRQGAELQLLHQLATHPRKLTVDRLDIVPQNSRLLLIVSAYFTGVAEDDAAAPAAR